jgi:hypothetical protein
VWQTRQLSGTSFWKGKSAVVLPAGDSKVQRVWKISKGLYVASEEAIRDCFIGIAKDWIDGNMEKEKSLGQRRCWP